MSTFGDCRGPRQRRNQSTAQADYLLTVKGNQKGVAEKLIRAQLDCTTIRLETRVRPSGEFLEPA